MNRWLITLITFILTLFLPYLGAYFRWGGNPPGYGHFPAIKVVEAPPVNEYFFTFGLIVAGLIALFLCYPFLFGFQKLPSLPASQAKKQVNYPAWFYPSLVVMLVSWFFMWVRIEATHWISTYTFVPLWWGFILVLDGIVYKRNEGVSLVSSKPNMVKLLAVVSAFSWFVFEYMNFFVLDNWYYPNDKILTNFGNISWQLLSYTTVLPAIFEWYWLLRTFERVDKYYQKGFKIVIPKPLQALGAVLGLALLFFMGYFPFEMFWVLWVCLVPALVPALEAVGYWTPFSPIGKKGDWSYVLLIAVATLLNGFFWELWNYGSEAFISYAHTNPNYWKYSVPYLDRWHFFSEMPFLGYFGYLFFGNVCWVLWITIAYLLDFEHDIDFQKGEAGNN